MATEATRQGVEVNEHYKSRMSEIDAIAGDEDQAPPEPVEDTPPPVVDDEPTEPVEPVDDAPADEPVEEPKISLKEKRTLKVDGQEQEATVEELIEAGIRARQKESAADQRLAEATQLLRQAQEATRPQPSQDAAPKPPEVDAAIVQAIQQGSEEEAAQALQSLMERQRTTPDQLGNVVASQVQAILDARDTQTKFQQAYPDIVKDERLFFLAAQDVQRRLNAGEPNTWETYDAAGKEIAGWFKLTKPDTSMQDKEQRKRTVTQLPSAGGKLPSKPEDKPESVQDVINEIRAARKQI